jgi:hypothetical protein
MEASYRLTLVTFLLEEATCRIALLQRAITAHERAWEENRYTTPGLPRSPEQSTLQAEQALWEQVRQGLTSVRTALEQIDHSEHQRGITVKRVWR